MPATLHQVRLLTGQLGLDACERMVVVAEIDAASASLAGCYEHLPASARASVIRVGHALGNLRRRLTARKMNTLTVRRNEGD